MNALDDQNSLNKDNLVLIGYCVDTIEAHILSRLFKENSIKHEIELLQHSEPLGVMIGYYVMNIKVQANKAEQAIHIVESFRKEDRLSKKQKPSDKVYYPRLIRRIYASMIDGLVMAGLFYSFFYLSVSIGIKSGVVIALMVFVPFVFYEPVLVSLFGGTIGHYFLNLRVRKKNKDIKVNIIQALLRFIFKYFLGFYSFLYVLISSSHQTLHDKLTFSRVIIRDPEKLPDCELLEER